MREEDRFRLGFSRQIWKVKRILSGLIFCGKLLRSVGSTVGSPVVWLKFGRGVVDLFILDLNGGISLWFTQGQGNTTITFCSASCPFPQQGLDKLLRKRSPKESIDISKSRDLFILLRRSVANETARKSQNEDAIYSSRENITRSKLAMVETYTTEAEKYW
ncbi:hypothetical protein F2Q68_00038988 [Brassica cretica]|uniref:Uncharacterized protein n=2 Tax=Brassica cretica TaxID=69181 RepID=A0ABQ7AN40_BRACR|nr:hypothetical protein F2Q68_00038988 [Brassica cretica]KAF3498970.1 hypothetical protein DY000_02052564 [Brassica cretica]